MYRLTRGPMTLPARPMLDASQRAVVDHPGGPLLVLAGPGTGKTTTLVECVVDRIERRGVAPDSILVLTFSRKAVVDLRARIAARLGRTTVTPMAMTFHAFCYALVRRFGNEADAESNGFEAPASVVDRTRAGVPRPGSTSRESRNSASPMAGIARSRVSHSGVCQ